MSLFSPPPPRRNQQYLTPQQQHNVTENDGKPHGSAADSAALVTSQADAKALDYCDAHSRDAVAEAFAGRGFTWPEPDAAQAPSRERPSDLRLQMQPVKLSFMVTKRRQDLIKAGLTLRQEAGSLTIQKLLDQTFFARQRSSGEGSGGVIGFPSDEVMSDVDVGSGFDMREWRRMTFAYSEEMGWAFLHQATSETLAMVKGLVR